MTQNNTKKELLRQAYEKLSIANVYLNESMTSIDNKFAPHVYTTEEKLNFQYRHDVSERQRMELKSDNDETIYLWRFFAKVGARFVVPKDDGDDVKAEIVATFIGEYQQTDLEPLNEEALNIFGKENVLYHVWPYWREYLQNMCARMKLPDVTLPMLIMHSKTNDK